MVDKGYHHGTHRLVPPAVTWSWISPHLADFGITRVADVTGLDDIGIPVFQAVRPEGHVLAVSQGKGLTNDLARVSAVMEAVELWHAERVRGAVVRGSAAEVGNLPYELRDLPLEPRSLVSDDLQLDWLDATGLLSGEPVLVPRKCVWLSMLARPGWSFPTFAVSSNGLASGNSRAEAALHALCEVVERHCIAQAAEIPLARRPRVELASIDDPDCCALLARFEASGVALEVFDATGDFGVPVYQAIISSPSLPVRFGGAGCHLEPAVALSRALTEAAQSRLTAIAGARDDLDDVIYASDHDGDNAWQQVSAEAGDVSFARAQSLASHTIDGDLTRLATMVRDLTGVEPFVVDLARPPHQVPVVMVFAPRLRGITEG
jgi:ribosomal protein S12 methylthiotransferase accessory factor